MPRSSSFRADKEPAPPHSRPFLPQPSADCARSATESAPSATRERSLPLSFRAVALAYALSSTGVLGQVRPTRNARQDLRRLQLWNVRRPMYHLWIPRFVYLLFRTGFGLKLTCFWVGIRNLGRILLHRVYKAREGPGRVSKDCQPRSE
jgi:hypothetical protein